MAMIPKNLIHIYAGDGKGKTTASLGLVVRALGAGMRPLFLQFLKGQYTSELASLEKLGVEYYRTDEVKKFLPYMDDAERMNCQESHRALFARAREAMACGDYDLVVLDEVIPAVEMGLLDETELLDALAARSAWTEVVLTGRNPSDKLIQAADYVSVIQGRKHPYDRGIMARRGIEY